MRRLMLRLAENLVLCGLILLGLTFGSAAAESQLGNEDLLFSYAPERDRLVFSGLGQLGDGYSGLDQPDRSTLYLQDLKTGAKTKVLEVLNGGLGNSVIAPSGTTIAVQVSVYQGDVSSNPRLLVLTAEGKEITAFAHSRDFSWSPDSRFGLYGWGMGGYRHISIVWHVAL